MIYNVRGKQVMLDSDLAILYGTTTKRINETVKRNINRFPEEFCFKLTKEELDFLRSQIATLEIKPVVEESTQNFYHMYLQNMVLLCLQDYLKVK